jgi:hypothetical protein
MRRSAALAPSTPSRAMVAPFIVPRRTSSTIPTTASAPTTAASSGASPAWAWVSRAWWGSQKG